MTGIIGSTIGTMFSGQKISIVQKANTSIRTAGTNNLTSGAITTTVDKIYLVILAWDPVAGTLLPSVTLSDGANTYTALNAAVSYPTGALTAGTGVITQAFTTTAAATATRTITATFSSSITAKTMIVLELTGATTTQSSPVVTQRPNDALTPSITTSPAYDLILTYCAAETNTGGAGTVSIGTLPVVQLTAATTSGGNVNTNTSLTASYYLITTASTTVTPSTSTTATNWVMQTIKLQAA